MFIIRKFIPVVVLASLLLTACGGATPSGPVWPKSGDILHPRGRRDPPGR